MARSVHQAASSGRPAFTLVELLVVVAVIALLVALILPTLLNAQEWGRISACGSILHGIGTVLHQYVTDNNDYLMPYCYTDELSYEVLPHGVDGNGNPYDDRYGAGYDHHNLLAPYLGLGNCMPVENVSGTWWPQWDKWAMAKYSYYPQFQCPSGVMTGTPYGPADGFYMQQAGWSSQPQVSGPEWPVRMAYFPQFRDTAQATLFFECGAATG